jgi:segregation and condensation protein B
MEMKELEAAIEAILFASGEPISLSRLASAIDIEESTTEKLTANLADRLDSENRGLKVLKLGDAYQLATKNEYAPYIKAALSTRRESMLSAAALEVLAIIAYHQPVTRGYINQVRGVDCKEVMDKLEEKSLIEECGKLDAPGRPRLYATTPDFLRIFGLQDIKDLPQVSVEKTTEDLEKFEV